MKAEQEGLAVGDMQLDFRRAGASSRHGVQCHCCVLSLNSTALTGASPWLLPVPSDADGYLEPRAGQPCGLTAKEDDKILA